MILAALIMSIIALIFGIVSLFVLSINSNEILDIHKTLLTQATDNVTGVLHQTVNSDNTYSEQFKDGYNEGRKEVLDILHLAMYDLYRCGEILDFQNQTDEITTRMLKLLQEDIYRGEVLTNLNEFIKEKEDDNNPNNY